MKTPRPMNTLRPLLTAAFLLPLLANAQLPGTRPAPPAPAAPDVALPELDPALAPKAPALSTPIRVMPAVKPAAPVALPKTGITLNFQDASLSDVLNYLSEAAGFVVVQEAKVEGKVNVVSRQPITAEDAVDLLNTVLLEKGYVAIRNGRILKIVSRKNAEKRDLPVRTGSDPELIPRKDEMVTQILPVRYGEAAKLVENLRPLLAETSTISANESSNSLILTDTQTNIRRIAEIIRAIDTSVAGISTLKVYPLQYANAKDLATVVTQLFASSAAGGTGGTGGRGGRGGGGGGFPGFPGFGGGGQTASTGQSEARQANSRVIAVADDQSNSLIVSAPEEIIPSITEIVTKIDTSITEVTDTRIFRLQNADAMETAEMINTLYGDTTAQAGQARNGNNQGRQGGGGFGAFFGQQQPAATGGQSGRALLQAKVVAVGDGRTNSLIVTAARETLTQIAETIGRLDASNAKKQHVYVHSLQHADAEGVAEVLRGMLGQQTNTNAAQSGAGRLNTRSATGAAMDTSDASSNLSGSGTGAGRAR